MNDMTQSSCFCNKCGVLARAFKYSGTRKICSWRFHKLHFLSRPLFKTKNYSSGSLFVKAMKKSFVCNWLQHTFEEEKIKNG